MILNYQIGHIISILVFRLLSFHESLDNKDYSEPYAAAKFSSSNCQTALKMVDWQMIRRA